MKKLFVLFCFTALAWACGSDKPAELYVPKNTVEFAGNAFTSFSLGADVKLYTSQNPDASKEWTVQAVIPVRKEVKGAIDGLSINLVPLDERGIRIRDGFVLEGEDLANLVPVYNSADNIERTIVFSVAQDGVKKYFTKKEAEKHQRRLPKSAATMKALSRTARYSIVLTREASLPSSALIR